MSAPGRRPRTPGSDHAPGDAPPVRPTWPDDPAKSPAACTGGRGGRTLYAADRTCATCGLRRSDRTFHCFLYERCDQCGDPENPCTTVRWMNEQAQLSAPQPRRRPDA